MVNSGSIQDPQDFLKQHMFDMKPRRRRFNFRLQPRHIAGFVFGVIAVFLVAWYRTKSAAPGSSPAFDYASFSHTRLKEFQDLVQVTLSESSIVHDDLQHNFDTVKDIEILHAKATDKDTAVFHVLNRWKDISLIATHLQTQITDRETIAGSLLPRLQMLRHTEKDIGNSEAALEAQRSKLQEAGERIDMLATELLQAESDRDEIRKDFNQFQSSLVDVVGVSASLRGKLSDANNELSRAKDAVHGQKLVIAEMRKRLETSQLKHEQFIQRHYDSDQEQKTISLDISRFSDQISDLNMRILSDENDLISTETQIKQLERFEEEVKNLERLSGQHQHAANLDASIQKQQQELDNLRRTLDTVSTENSIEEAADPLVSKMQAYNKNIKRLALLEAETKLETLKTLQSHLDADSSMDGESLRQEVEQRKSTLLAKIKKSQASLADAQTTKQNLDVKLKQLEISEADLKTFLNSVDSTAQAFTEEKTTLELSIENAIDHQVELEQQYQNQLDIVGEVSRQLEAHIDKETESRHQQKQMGDQVLQLESKVRELQSRLVSQMRTYRVHIDGVTVTKFQLQEATRKHKEAAASLSDIKHKIQQIETNISNLSSELATAIRNFS